MLRELKGRSEFCIRGDEFVEQPAKAMQLRAFKALIDVLPEPPESGIEGMVEQAVTTKYGTVYFGWAAGIHSSYPPYVFAVTNDLAALVETRFQRADVMAAKGLRHQQWGFSYASKTMCDYFVAVASGRKATMRIERHIGS